MRHAIILGPGASCKSTLARRLSEITCLPVIELDKLFWRKGHVATPNKEWVEIQQKLVEPNKGLSDRWVLDGDLRPHDDVEVRGRGDGY